MLQTTDTTGGMAVAGPAGQPGLRTVPRKRKAAVRARTESWTCPLGGEIPAQERRAIVRQLRREVADWATRHAVPMATLMAFQMALGEAVTNAAMHAENASRICITISVAPGRIRFDIDDDGSRPVDARAWLDRERRVATAVQADPAKLEECHRGFLCIDEHMDQWECTSSERGTRVSGEKRWKPMRRPSPDRVGARPTHSVPCSSPLPS